MIDLATKREGWYSDPLKQADLRWWDSRRWTHHIKSVRASRREPTSSALAPVPAWAGSPEPAGERVVDVQLPVSGEGWREVAAALSAAGSGIVTVRAAGVPTLTVDMTGGVYWWDLDLEDFPAQPGDLRVETAMRGLAVVPGVAGRDLEPLLWRVGTASFSGTNQLVIDPAARYKLRRWPNFASMPHSAEQLRLTTVMAHAQLTPGELAAVSGVSEQEVQALIATYDLMSVLDAVEDPIQVARQMSMPASGGGLFSRMRVRLEW